MGFLSKIWKGVKGVVKKIGKGIKSAFKKFGKFMGKIGILGQVAMFFIMPYIGAALGGAFTGAAGALATNTVGGALGAVGQAAGKVMQFVGNTVGKVGTVFNNITKGVTDTLGNFAKTASNKLFGTTFEASANFFGAGDSAWNRSFGGESRFQNLTSDNVFFEDIKKSRQVQLDRKTMNALDQTVTESASDWDSFEYGQKEFANNSAVDQAIADGKSNWTASLEDTIPDAGAFEPTISTDPQFKPNYGPPEPSLLEKIADGIKGIPDRVTGKISEVADDPLGYAFKGTEESLQQQVNLRVGQELGISEKPKYVQNYTTNNAYVPSFESFGGSQQQYGAQEIMNARSFEQQVTNNPSPYGYTAFQYGNYMAQLSQTA